MSVQVIETDFNAPDSIFPDNGNGNIPNDVEIIQQSIADEEVYQQPPETSIPDVPEQYLKPSHNDILELTTMVQRITTTKRMYPDELSHIPNPSQLRKYTLEELEDMAYDIEMNLDAKMNVDAIMGAGMTGIGAIEAIGPLIAVKTSGLKKTCENSTAFQSALRRCALKYANSVCVSPEYALGIALVQAVQETHKLNCELEKRSERVAANIPIPSSVQQAGVGL